MHSRNERQQLSELQQMMVLETRKVQAYRQLIRKRAEKEEQRLSNYRQEENKVHLVPGTCLHSISQAIAGLRVWSGFGCSAAAVSRKGTKPGPGLC